MDKYLLVRKVGKGGMGTVYVGIQKPLMREVAVKLLTTLDANTEIKARFFREARAMAMLNHPNVVRLYDFDMFEETDRQSPFIVMEYLKDGLSLREWFNKKKADEQRVTLMDVQSVFVQVLKGLNTAHKTGLIHRDIKPENIMVVPFEDDLDQVKILDFGLAKAIGGLEGFDTHLSHTGSMMGTAHYMAPEQTYFSKKGQVVTATADLYAVGVMLFEVFAGKKPFTGENHKEIIWQKVNPEYDPFSIPEARVLPDKLRDFLSKAMDRDPQARFPDASGMLQAFNTMIFELDTNTTPLGLSPHRGFTSSKPIDEIRSSGSDSSQEPETGRIKKGLNLAETETGAEDSFHEIRSGRRTIWLLAGIILAVIAGAVFWYSGLSGPAPVKSPVPIIKTGTKKAGTIQPSHRRVESTIPALSRRRVAVQYKLKRKPVRRNPEPRHKTVKHRVVKPENNPKKHKILKQKTSKWL